MKTAKQHYGSRDDVEFSHAVSTFACHESIGKLTAVCTKARRDIRGDAADRGLLVNRAPDLVSPFSRVQVQSRGGLARVSGWMSN